jgi:hypothetical protein
MEQNKKSYSVINVLKRLSGKIKTIYIIIGIVILIFVFGLGYIHKVNADKFLSSLTHLSTSDIKKVIIQGENNKSVIINPHDKDLLDDFVKIIKKTKDWEPDHPLSIKRISITIYTHDEKYNLDCTLVKGKPGIVFIYVFEQLFMNARYQNKDLFRFLKRLDIF